MVAADRSLTDLKNSRDRNSSVSDPCFVLPDFFVRVLDRGEAIRYLKHHNCYSAFIRGDVDLHYDVRGNRVVFSVYNGSRLVNAVGRSLDYKAKPKWWIYGQDLTTPFVCGKSDVGILVEDCASACAVSEFATGIALLGTNLQRGSFSGLRRFKEIYIALDKDASRKALDMQRRLSYITKAHVLLLEEDLKYYGPDQLRSFLSQNGVPIGS